MDQRKAHVVARDVASKMRVSPLCNARGEQIKPVCVHHPILLGLKKPSIWPPPEADLTDYWASMKMSKSDRFSALFVHDSEEEIRRKPEHGGDLRFTAPEEVDEAFIAGKLHSADLKNGVADWLVDTLAPARRAFEQPDKRRLLEELEALTG
jgi:tyrosyl-tRNA synthetase